MRSTSHHMGDMNGYCGPNSLPVDNWFSNENTDIKKPNEKPPQIRFHSKRPHAIKTLNDNINIDSTHAVSMNVRS